MPTACPARRGLRAAAVAAVAAVTLASCSPDQVTQPDPSGAPPDLGARAIAVHVNVAAGTATVLDRTGRPVGAGVSLALLGANEISATISSSSRSAVGQFIPKKVRITFAVALTNRSIAALLPPTFPTPPAGNTSVLLFPFATTLTAGNGAIDASTDWDGTARNFFNDASCSSGGKSDCYRWEPYPAPFAPGATTSARMVGFDVDPTVQEFTTYFVLAADLPVPASISGTVSSPQRGGLGHVVVTLTPTNRVTGTETNGTYGFTGVALGEYDLSLSGLPGYCEPAAPKHVNVASGANVTVDFSVRCPYIAFSSDRDGHPEIYRMNIDGTGQQRLTNGTCWADNPTWSPDGTKIAYGCFELTNPPVPVAPSIIYVMNADGSNAHAITNGLTRDWLPDWGPTGKISFSSFRDGNDELYVMDGDGNNARRLTFTPDSAELNSSWSPDGSQIVFDEQIYKRPGDPTEPDGDDDIWLINASGTNMHKLFGFPGGTDRNPAWSPAAGSTTIAFWSTSSGCCPSGDVMYSVDAVTGVATQLVNAQTSPVTLTLDPDWTPDGSKIVFAGLAGVATAFDIFTMNPDGSGMTNISNSAGSDRSPSWQP
jgi:Tol biopolymer transport system component